ncbi:hypothetical protein AJ80_08631 [Polytolypa hystricis UAMH7299]|uniref:tRNA(Phe) 7-[(3-amino-3-carboxypropyl)-4-demethylwyosine(37)-N(4)]-methyltransferase n=1 Tax=Polytolypa hystricis (strain UAMH7299) TaxID=1447883 RepID=A0A2B7X571_POLH7|nr:hypothetical protein AJ80_08631 [Polytolypa hystricis UAMH7299]
MTSNPPSQSFELKKQKILNDLSVPDGEYADLSPKGSVDVDIRELIDEINALPGLVTTSSCAGRISVFVEGDGGSPSPSAVIKAPAPSSSREVEEQGGREVQEHEVEGPEGLNRQFAATGGKGSGKWLYTTHSSMVCPRISGGEENSLHKAFGLTPGDGRLEDDERENIRLVRFHFEPMILHIMASSLQYAQPVLAAATSAGFRESGIQSLRCLSDAEACPIVAVRSSGLAFQSIVGYQQVIRSPSPETPDTTTTTTTTIVTKSLVSEDYLRMLVSAANVRFGTNFERKERFRRKLLELCSGTLSAGGSSSSRREGWEDPQARKERKRAEGLLRSKVAKEAAAKVEQSEIDSGNVSDDEMSIGLPYTG